MLALLAGFCCTAAGSRGHVHTVLQTPSARCVPPQVAPAPPAPHDPGDHCSHEARNPGWQRSAPRTDTGEQPRTAAVDEALPQIAEPSGAPGARANTLPVIAAERDAPARLCRICLWRI
jgi:hypothetical protein